VTGPRARPRGERRPGPEQEEADLQRPLAAEAVADRTGGQEQAGEDEHVAVEDPLQVARAGREIPAQARDRDVEDGVVQADHQQAQAQHGQRPPPPAIDQISCHSEFLSCFETLPFRNVRSLTPLGARR
jgi:hypothetical protein